MKGATRMRIGMSAWVVVASCFATIAWSQEKRKLDEFPKDEKGFHAIFNGKDLAGWTGTASWKVEGGEIVFDPKVEVEVVGERNLLVLDAEMPADFELTFKAKNSGGETGLFFRATRRADGTIDGYRLVMELWGWKGSIYDVERGKHVRVTQPKSHMKRRADGVIQLIS